MAHVSNILKDKLFVFSNPSKCSSAEKDILELICFKEGLTFQNCSVESNGENYDSYKLLTKEKNLFAKISLDGKTVLEKDFAVLQNLKGLKITPEPISFGQINYGENIDYSLTSYENFESCEFLGKSILLFNSEAILDKLKEIHSQKIDLPNLSEYLRIHFDETSFGRPEFKELLETNSHNFQLLEKELSLAKEEIQSLYKEEFNGQSLCHGKLKPSNILLGARDLKITNWQNSFLANPLIDLADLRMSFDVDDSFEFKMFNYYNNENKYKWENYLKCRNFWAAVKLIDYIFSYIKEIYLFRALRQDKILNTFSNFCRNAKYFETLESFKRNKEDIISLFSQPML